VRPPSIPTSCLETRYEQSDSPSLLGLRGWHKNWFSTEFVAMRVNAPFKSHSCNTFLLTVSCWGDIALFQGGSAYGLQANVGGGNFALTRLRPERQCCGRLWSRISPRTLWSVQTKWTRGLPGGAGCCGARTSRTPANGLRRWLSLASLLQALRGSLRQSTFFCR